jgi:hypothetical protein
MVLCVGRTLEETMIKRMMVGGMGSIAVEVGLGALLLLVAGPASAQQVIPQQAPMAPAQTYPAQPYPGQVPQQPVYAQPQQPVYAQPQAVAPQQQVVVQAAAVAPQASAGTGTEDQRMWVGHLGIGWFGTIPVDIGSDTAGNPAATLQTPLIGIRYWLSPATGLDLGVGFASKGGNFTDINGNSTDDPAFTAFGVHAGIPIVLGNTQHLSIQLTPETNIGVGTGSQKAGTNDVSHSGLLIDVGARAGAELYFGFIGIPALALEGSVGLFLRSTSAKTDVGGASEKRSLLTVGTSSINQPWDIFRSNVAARYYF